MSSFRLGQFCMILCAAPVLAAPLSIDPVVLSTDFSIGFPTGSRFSSLNAPSVNDSGDVAFAASVFTSLPSPQGQGVWKTSSGQLSLVAAGFEPLPGTPAGSGFFGLANSGVFINELGDVAFHAKWNAVNWEGIWVTQNAQLTLAARNGSASPSGFSYSTFSSATFNDLGEVAFRATLNSGTQISPGVYAGKPGALRSIIRIGEQIPDLPAGHVLYLPSVVQTNRNGTVSLYGEMYGPPAIPFENSRGLFQSATSGFQTVVQGGASAPGMPTGTIFLDFLRHSMNLNNDEGFVARLRTSSGDEPQAVFGMRSGVPYLAALGESSAAGTSGIFEEFVSVVTSASGEVAFNGRLRSGVGGVTNFTSRGIWTNVGGSLRLLARAGDPAPGLPGFIIGETTEGAVAMNSSGQIVFTASASGPGQANRVGVWMTDPYTGDAVPVLLQGQTYDLDPGVGSDLRTLSEFSRPFGTNGQDGSYTSLNERGELALRLDFTDGTHGIFLIAIPEPASVGLTAVAAAALRRRQRSAG